MKIRLLRKFTQLATLALLIAMPLLNLRGIDELTGSLYSLAIGPVWITDPLSAFQVVVTTLSIDSTLLLSISIPVVFALALGRVFCGWICPQNFLSEIADYLRSWVRIERPVKLPPSPVPRYVVLAIMLLLTFVAGFPVANLISAPGIISVQTSEYIMSGTVGIEVSLIAVIIMAEFFISRRFWCNYACPVGGFLGLFRISKTMRVAYHKETDKCIRCGACIRACQLGLNPMGGKIYPLCHNCGDCIAACEKATGKENPLAFRF